MEGIILYLSRDFSQHLVQAVLSTTGTCVCMKIQTCLCINRASPSALKSLHSVNILHRIYCITLPLSILLTSANSQGLTCFFT